MDVKKMSLEGVSKMAKQSNEGNSYFDRTWHFPARAKFFSGSGN